MTRNPSIECVWSAAAEWCPAGWLWRAAGHWALPVSFDRLAVAMRDLGDAFRKLKQRFPELEESE